jgi:hypothetical protein
MGTKRGLNTSKFLWLQTGRSSGYDSAYCIPNTERQPTSFLAAEHLDDEQSPVTTCKPGYFVTSLCAEKRLAARMRLGAKIPHDIVQC